MARDAAPAQPEAKQEDMTFFLASTPYEENGPRLAPTTAGSNRAPPTIPSTTGPVGEPALPPSRPTSNTNPLSPRVGTTSGPTSRRGVSSSAGGRTSYQSEASPPPTPASRTHVPNIISSAFLRPMSSKRAQQDQDAQRPMSPPLPIARPSVESTRRSHRHRNSNASIVTVEGQQRPLVDPDAPPLPTSRGTATTTRETRTDTDRVGSMESGAALVPRTPAPLQIGTQTRSSSLQPQASPRSPRSLRPSWGRHSRGRNEHSTTREGHTKLSSVPPSPAYTTEKTPVNYDRANLGKNYEYYNGNSIFFLKGRLINTRQRPLNLLTALLAILPAILFFIFSYVIRAECHDH